MPTYRLAESARATADNNGRAVARIGPQRAFETWNVTRLTVQSTSSTLVPTAKVYQGLITDSLLIDGTYTGTLDHTDTSIRLESGHDIIVVWEGGDVGSECTFTVQGTSSR